MAAPATLWLAAPALNGYESDARLRSWLTEEGLLTQRMRRIAGDRFRLRVIHEGQQAGAHVREIELLCDTRPWLYAETRIPDTTLALHPWLATLGSSALGERLASRHDVTREPFGFARGLETSVLVRRALSRTELSPQPLWVRRSRYRVGDAPFVLHEVFFTDTGDAG